jgi:transposase-like protein
MAKITELDAAIDNLLKNYKTPEEILGENGLLKQLTKAVLQRALQAEMTHHLGHEKHGAVTSTDGNARNGSSAKTIKGDFGLMPLEIPRDRDSSFEPIIHVQTSVPGFKEYRQEMDPADHELEGSHEPVLHHV